MNRTVTAVSLAALAFAAPAHAENVTAANPNSVVGALQDAGYKAELTKSADGAPYITSAASGSTFIVFFNNCDAGKCSTLQFYGGFPDARNATNAAMNEWNSNHRFTRAYSTDKGAARIEMDIDLDLGGISPALFKDNLEIWVSSLADFAKTVSGK